MATKTIEWIAGWNLPGYLPETEPEGFETWEDAHAYIVATMESWWDQDHDLDSVYLPVHTEMHAATVGESISYLLEYGHKTIGLWVDPA